ncbi:MAG: thiol reductase thioredoxin, partial [Burkholderiales bacterium]|nr:thiol reductase thioredoxin [Burkholderiales bacterium]
MRKFLLPLALSLAAGLAAAADRPYDESADAKAQIAVALRDAAAAHEPVLL